MNKWLKSGLIILTLFLFGFLAIQAKNYFEGTYVGEDYYMQVPANQSTTIDEWHEGEYTIRGKQYKFTAYSATGNPNALKFEITDYSDGKITEDELLGPNMYLKIHASAARVIRWEIIQVGDVPEGVLAAINANR